jgi:thermitase
MPNNHRARVLIFATFILFLCLLVWNLGADISPVSAFQDLDPFTPTNTQTDAAPPPDNIHTETPAPTENPTDSSTISEQNPTSTLTQASASDASDSDRLPLPAVFGAGRYAQDELVVRFKPSTNRTRIDECFQGIDVQIRSEIEELHTFVLRIVSGEVASTFYYVLNCAGVLYVEPNFLLQAADTIPNDPGWGLQYGLINIRAPQGWDLSTGSAAVTIAIVDSGVDYGHPDLAGKLVAGYDFVNDDSNPQDDYGHGTHVAGIAAASSNNGAGIAGLSWGARIMPVKVLNASGGGTFANTAAGVVWAVDHGAQIINLSLGGTGESALLEDAINYAYSKGAVVVAAAGNTGGNFVLYPARYPNAIAVARTNSANNWDGSNYGPEIDLSAPGASIYSTVIGGYGYNSGSSMSTGFVSGLAAILVGIPGNASPGLIRSQMESTALDIEFTGRDDYTGAGLIQVDAAINMALQSVTPTTEPSNPTTGSGPGSIQGGVTNTPIPTWTTSLTPSTHEQTVTFTPETGTTESVVETMSSTQTPPIGERSEVEAQDGNKINSYIMPCMGILLILLGIGLIWMFRRKQ